MLQNPRRPRRAGPPILAALAVAALAAALGACNDITPPPPPGSRAPADDAPPQARLSIVLDDVVVEGYAYTAFACNPLESSDDHTPRHELGIRWDWENDGVWDTTFRPLEYASGFVPSPLPTGVWSAKCEVRDGAGHIVGVADTIALPDPWYGAPDLVARRATVDTSVHYSETDTVYADQPFRVMANHLRWTERDTPGWMTIALYLDGELIQRSRHPVAPNLHWASDTPADDQYDDSRRSVAMPGVHTLTVVVDADDEVDETDENNNVSTRTFVVLP